MRYKTIIRFICSKHIENVKHFRTDDKNVKLEKVFRLLKEWTSD
jgi:hypothetical protein